MKIENIQDLILRICTALLNVSNAFVKEKIFKLHLWIENIKWR